ncbi:MAG: hypothetical protein ACOC3V_05125, partial [bacterium]
MKRCILLFSFLMTYNVLVAGLLEWKINNEPAIIDNAVYEKVYAPPDYHTMFHRIMDIAVIKLPNNPMYKPVSIISSIVGSDLSMFNNIPTIFLLDSQRNAVLWPNYNTDIHPATSSYELYDNNQLSGFASPKGIAVTSNGNNAGVKKLLVADTNNDRLVEFTINVDNKGIELINPKIIGRRGSGYGEFKGPQGVCYDSIGNIYVADNANKRIQKLDCQGVYISNIIYDFEEPTDVAVGLNTGNIYICDQALKKIIVFDDGFSKIFETPPDIQKEYYKLSLDVNEIVYATNGNDEVYELDTNVQNIISMKLYDKNCGISIGVNNVFDNDNWYTKEFAVSVGHKIARIHRLGVTIEELYIDSLPGNILWINTNSGICYPVLSDVIAKISSPGGVFRIIDYFKGDGISGLPEIMPRRERVIDESVINPITPGVHVFSFDPYIDSEQVLSEGEHRIFMNINDGQYSDIKTFDYNVYYDIEAPFSYISIDENYSTILNDNIYVNSQTDIFFDGSDTGSGISYYEYSVDGGLTWRRVFPENPVFNLLESDGEYGINNIITLQYRAVDNVGNVS